MYVYPKTRPALEYYIRYWRLPDAGWVLGKADFEEPGDLAVEYGAFRPGRTWMLFSELDDTEACIRSRVAKLGQIVTQHASTGSVVYLCVVGPESRASGLEAGS